MTNGTKNIFANYLNIALEERLLLSTTLGIGLNPVMDDLRLAGTLPRSRTLNLESMPGNGITLFLDVNGYTAPSGDGYRYAGESFGAWDDDGQTGWSDDEHRQIQEMWAVTAENFAPFNINVTTKDPGIQGLRYAGPDDTEYGVRIVISPDSYNSSSSSHTIKNLNGYKDPAFVKSVLNQGFDHNVITHELGHALGLGHDGGPDDNNREQEYYKGHGVDGQGRWTAFMGGGTGSSLISQWSKGEYYGATKGPSSDNFQDDLAQIASYVGYKQDDHSNERLGTGVNAPTGLNLSDDGQFFSYGLIEKSNDEDWFQFDFEGGYVELAANVFEFEPSLDVRLNVYNSSGNRVLSNNPASSLNAKVTGFLDPGTYFVRVDNSSWGNPMSSNYDNRTGYTTYGSLGWYTLSGSLNRFEVSEGINSINLLGNNTSRTIESVIAPVIGNLSITSARRLQYEGMPYFTGTQKAKATINFSGQSSDTTLYLVSQSPLTTDLELYWKFEEGSGRIFHDYSGNNMTGFTSNGLSDLTWINGPAGLSDGANSTHNAITINPVNMNRVFEETPKVLSNDWSISFWIKPQSAGNQVEYRPFARNTQGDDLRFGNLAGDEIRYVFPKGGSLFATDNLNELTTPIRIGRWSHVAMVQDGNQMLVYVDGNLSANFTYSMDLLLDGFSDMQGSRDEFRVYSRALTANDVEFLSRAQTLHHLKTFDTNGKEVSTTRLNTNETANGVHLHTTSNPIKTLVLDVPTLNNVTNFRDDPGARIAIAWSRNGSTWSNINIENATVDINQGTNGLDKITLTLAQAQENAWYRVSFTRQGNLGFDNDETYYFGHLKGDTRNDTSGDFKVDFLDVLSVWNNIDNPSSMAYDFDQSEQVDFLDVLTAWNEVGNSLPRLDFGPQSSPPSSTSTPIAILPESYEESDEPESQLAYSELFIS